MKKVYFILLILFIVLLFISPVILAEPNTDLNVLLHSEDKEDTATHLKLYASDEITPNKNIIYSIVITASVPSPLGQGNVIDQGLVALVVPEDIEVDYRNIKIYGAPTADSNRYVEYQPESKSTKELFDILGLIISKIPVLGLVMDLSPIYQARPGDYGEFIDLNQYDIIKVNWEAPRLKYWQKVQIDIPVHLGDDVGIGLYAYWQSRASSSDGTGPTFARDNMVDIGFNISEKKLEAEVISRPKVLTWEKIFGGSGDDYPRSLIQTTDGGYALSGDTESYGAVNGDFWVIKLDSDGKKEWEKIFGGSDHDWGLSIVQTTDGGYALAGCTELYGSGKDDFWVIKLDSDGKKEWEKTFNGSDDDDVVESLIQTTDGGYALAGYTKSYVSSKDDSWLIKLDSDGKKEWEKTFGGIYYDYAESLVQTTDGGYAVAGVTHQSYGLGNADSWVIKLDEQGNLSEILEEESISTGAFDYSEELRAITSVISNFYEAINNQEWAQAKKYCLIDSEVDLSVNEAKDSLERDFDSDTKINFGFIISDIDIDNISAKVNYIQKSLMTCKGEIIQEDIDKFEILLENINNQWKICEMNFR